jgi:predicted GNAT family acetyltransferase
MLHVVRHTDPDAFLAAAAPMRARGEASASIFTTWAHGVRRSPPRADERLYLATCTGAGGFGVAVQRDEGPVILGASDLLPAAAFADDLATDLPELQGVMGAPGPAQAFAQRWRDHTGRVHTLRVQLRQHVLTAVADVPAAPGGVRIAGDADIPWLIDAQIAFISEVGMPDTAERVRSWLPKRVGRDEIRVWEHDGPVAFAGFMGAAPELARIAPVYTFPGHRHRGYATALTAALSRELLESGKRAIFLTTDIANPTSNAIYARIGFRAENDDHHYDFVAAEG